MQTFLVIVKGGIISQWFLCCHMEMSVCDLGWGAHNLLFESFGASVRHQAGVERADVLELMCLCLPDPEAGSHLASSKGHHIPCRAVAPIGARIHRSCV